MSVVDKNLSVDSSSETTEDLSQVYRVTLQNQSSNDIYLTLDGDSVTASDGNGAEKLSSSGSTDSRIDYNLGYQESYQLKIKASTGSGNNVFLRKFTKG